MISFVVVVIEYLFLILLIREVWRKSEEYSRDLVEQGKELYIIAGGEGSKGKLAQGKVNIPQTTWKVVVVMDEPTVTENTRAITKWRAAHDRCADAQ